MKSQIVRPVNEIEWLTKYFMDLSQLDKESDSFRYPFHIVRESDEGEKKYTIKSFFDNQIHIDLVKFANKFEAAHEIIKKWYLKETDSAIEWRELNPIFIETGGCFYGQSVVGYQCTKEAFFPYVNAYLETANYLKYYMKNKTDEGENEYKKHLFLPMCYLYRNCVELNLKKIWLEDIRENSYVKYKEVMGMKHSIGRMWNKIKPYVLEYGQNKEELEYIEVVEDYCKQIQKIDSDANRFRYPMSNTMQVYFTQNKRFDFMCIGDFFEALNNGLDGISMQINHVIYPRKIQMMIETGNYL